MTSELAVITVETGDCGGLARREELGQRRPAVGTEMIRNALPVVVQVSLRLRLTLTWVETPGTPSLAIESVGEPVTRWL